MGSTRFTQLRVWEKAHQAVLSTYRLTVRFPVDERYGLTSQMRRAAVSIPANIAEGFGRRRGADRARFYEIARGSAEELKYYLILSRDLGYSSDVTRLEASLDEVCAMIYSLKERMLSEDTAR